MSPGCGSPTRPPAPSWGRWFSPLGCWTQVAPQHTRDALRGLFERWGRPEQLRVDNGMPWGSPGDLPTDLVCWLAGLGVPVRANRPRRPQDNGVVERCQGVGKLWSEPATCSSVAALQERLDVLDRWHRECYPAVRGRSRLEAYPGLRHSGRVYQRASEDQDWALAPVWELMSTHLVRRQVDKQGRISLYNRPYTVGLAWSGRPVWLGFDALTGDWTFQDATGHEIRRQRAKELTRASIEPLAVTHRRRGIHAAKPTSHNPEAEPTSR